MANSWYVGSVQYAAVAVFQALHVYSVGDFLRQIAPTDANSRVFRVTTAGTSGAAEPAYNVASAQTTNSGSAVFTEVTGNSAYGWSAAGKNISNCMFANSFAAGDTIYVASNHAFSTSAAISNSANTTTSTVTKVLCVNPAGSVPPVAADLTTGATETSTGSSVTLDGTMHVYGVSYTSSTGMALHTNIEGAFLYENMNLTITGAGAVTIQIGATDSSPNGAKWKGVIVKFGGTGQSLTVNRRFHWDGGSVDAAGSIPTNLFKGSATPISLIEGVDLSAMGTNQLVQQTGYGEWQFLNCKLPNSYNFYNTPATSYGNQRIDAVICDSGNGNFKQERYSIEGALTTETTNVKTGGANDSIRPYSYKVVTTAKAVYSMPFSCFQLSVWNTDTGIAKTLEIDILSGGTLKDNDVAVIVEYLGSSASPIASRVTSASNILAAGANLTASSATWDTTGIGGATAQKLSVSFTPQMVGYIRYTVVVMKASSTVWIDPLAIIS